MAVSPEHAINIAETVRDNSLSENVSRQASHNNLGQKGSRVAVQEKRTSPSQSPQTPATPNHTGIPAEHAAGQPLIPLFQYQTRLQAKPSDANRQDPGAGNAGRENANGGVTNSKKLAIPANSTLEKLVQKTYPDHSARQLTRAVTKHALTRHFDEITNFLSAMDLLEKELAEASKKGGQSYEILEKSSIFQEKFQAIYNNFIDSKNGSESLNIKATILDKLRKQNVDSDFQLATLKEAKDEVEGLLKYHMHSLENTPEFQAADRKRERENKVQSEIISIIIKVKKELKKYLEKNHKDENWEPSTHYNIFCCCKVTFNKAAVFKILKNLKKVIPDLKVAKYEKLNVKEIFEAIKVAIPELLDTFVSEKNGTEFRMRKLLVEARDKLEELINSLVMPPAKKSQKHFPHMEHLAIDKKDLGDQELQLESFRSSEEPRTRNSQKASC